MKKILPIISMALIGIAYAQAQTELMPGLCFKQVSPTGKYIVSDNDEGEVKVVASDSRKVVYEIGDSESYDSYFFIGYGNAITDGGLMVGDFGSMPMVCDVIRNTSSILPIDEEVAQGGVAQGITPDGSTIIGILYTKLGIGLPFNIPVIWELQSDGTYSQPKILPYPEKDFIGGKPSQVDVYSISADGSTIVGQTRDSYQQAIIWPIVFRKDTNGDWTCMEVNPELLNPEGVKLPEAPGEEPSYPLASEFMTEEERAAYDEALDAYFNDEGEYPDPEDFLGEKSKEEYLAALKIYEEWKTKNDAFEEAYGKVVASTPNFWWNTALSPNGRYLTQFAGEMDYFYGIITGDSYIFDLDNHTYRTAGTSFAIQIFDDATVLGYIQPSAGTFIANIMLPGEDGFTSLDEWISGRNQKTAEWMQENMTHLIYNGYEGYDMEMIVSGRPCAPSDLSFIATTTQQAWDWESDDFGTPYSYILQVNEGTSDIKSITTSTKDKVDVYSINGMAIMLNTDKKALDTLPAGFYIIRQGSDTYKLIK